MDVDRIIHGDALEVLRGLPDACVDAVVTDPPYGLSEQPDIAAVLTCWLAGKPYTHGKRGFMGKQWDAFVPGPEYWREVFRVLKPGAHALVFAGTRTQDVMGIALRLAGFEIRDTVAWLYGSGFPKSLDIGKAIDKRGGANIGWFGPWLRAERTRRGMPQKQLAKYFLSNTGGLTGCVANWELGLNLPTPEQFNTLCEVLSLPFARIEEAEREVLATKHDTGKRQVTILGKEPRDYNITAPATDAARQWDGFGTALKPAQEPIILCRKPLAEPTIAANVLAWGTGGLNIDGCRVEGVPPSVPQPSLKSATGLVYNFQTGKGRNGEMSHAAGRWPANLVLDEAAAALLDAQSGWSTSERPDMVRHNKAGSRLFGIPAMEAPRYADEGGASRYFAVFPDDVPPWLYTAKASRAERDAGCEALPEKRWTDGRKQDDEDYPSLRGKQDRTNSHPTVKPIALMRWLVRLITPPGGVVLDCFAGSGTTAVAAIREGMHYLAIEREAEYVAIAQARATHATHATRAPERPARAVARRKAIHTTTKHATATTGATVAQAALWESEGAA